MAHIVVKHVCIKCLMGKYPYAKFIEDLPFLYRHFHSALVLCENLSVYKVDRK